MHPEVLLVQLHIPAACSITPILLRSTAPNRSVLASAHPDGYDENWRHSGL